MLQPLIGNCKCSKFTVQIVIAIVMAPLRKTLADFEQPAATCSLYLYTLPVESGVGGAGGCDLDAADHCNLSGYGPQLEAVSICPDARGAAGSLEWQLVCPLLQAGQCLAGGCLCAHPGCHLSQPLCPLVSPLCLDIVRNLLLPGCEAQATVQI